MSKILKMNTKPNFSRKTVQKISPKIVYVNLDKNFKNTHHAYLNMNINKKYNYKLSLNTFYSHIIEFNLMFLHCTQIIFQEFEKLKD